MRVKVGKYYRKRPWFSKKQQKVVYYPASVPILVDEAGKRWDRQRCPQCVLLKQRASYLKRRDAGLVR